MYHSSRSSKNVTSLDAILNGLADDGGLYVIDDLNKIDYKELFNLTYEEMASKILHVFFNEFTYDELLTELNEAYKDFDTKNRVEIKKCDNAYFLELYHGPTLAFKDMALVVLPRLMKKALEKKKLNKKITILTATSGDTGGASLNGFKNIPNISIIVLYPNLGVSKVQEAQMTSFRSENAKIYAVNGNFDDCQSAVKKFFTSYKDLNLSSANSINIARLAPQVVYYFYSYVTLVKNKEIAIDEEINFSVPTGNFGNILAGFLAKKMGLPIKNLICASNKNDVLTEYFNTNIYNKNREFYKTNSPSMDIVISSNFERFLYYGLNGDINLVNQKIKELNEVGYYNFINPFNYFYGYSTNEEDTLKTINDVYNNYNYLIDPHTAVSYNAYLQHKCNTKTVILSTASPYKFPDTVLNALKVKYDDPIITLSKYTNTKIPSVLNYPPIKKEVIELSDVDTKLCEVIKCLQSK